MKGYNPNTCKNPIIVWRRASENIGDTDNTSYSLPKAVVLFCFEDCCSGTAERCRCFSAENARGSRYALSDMNRLFPSQTLNGVYKSESPGYDRCVEHTTRSFCLNHYPNLVMVIFSSHMPLSLNVLRLKDHQSLWYWKAIYLRMCPSWHAITSHY